MPNAASTMHQVMKVNVLPCIGMENPYFYRNKIQMPLGLSKQNKIISGFYKEKISLLKKGERIIVYIDKKNPKRYYVDIEGTIKELGV